MAEKPEKWLKLDIQSYWHPGTGRGDGASADAVVARGSDGLPVLHGRTIKGLLRAAVHLGVAAKLATLDHEIDLFGSPVPQAKRDRRVEGLEEARYGSRPGRIRISEGRLGETREARKEWEQYARNGGREAEALLGRLRRTIASTRIDDDGVAHDSTLRTIEVYVPLVLYAPVEIQGAKAGDWKVIEECASLFLRSLGSHRNRGFGRCAAEFVGVTNV
jgi:hypothetical protein